MWNSTVNFNMKGQLLTLTRWLYKFTPHWPSVAIICESILIFWFFELHPPSEIKPKPAAQTFRESFPVPAYFHNTFYFLTHRSLARRHLSKTTLFNIRTTISNLIQNLKSYALMRILFACYIFFLPFMFHPLFLLVSATSSVSTVFLGVILYAMRAKTYKNLSYREMYRYLPLTQIIAFFLICSPVLFLTFFESLILSDTISRPEVERQNGSSLARILHELTPPSSGSRDIL